MPTAKKTLRFRFSLSLVPDNSFGEKCFDFGWIDVVKNESSREKKP